MTKYLYSKQTRYNDYPKIWKIDGTVQELPKGIRHVGFYGKEYYWDNFPVDYVLTYPINKFRVYVNSTDYIMSDLPPLDIKTKKGAKWSFKESYYQSLVGARITTYASGISIQHLTFKPDVPKQITSLMRFHLYFTVRRIMREFQTLPNNSIQYIMNKHNANFLQKHTPKWTWREVSGYKNEHLGQDVLGINPYPKTYGPGVGFIRDLHNVYKKFIPKISNGLTANGTELLNQSMGAYVYSVLGAQARTKQSIYGSRASALETQKVFRQIVEDSIINYNTSKWINNMNQAVTSTNVVFNMANSPTLWLIPSNLIILEKPIVRYNNELKVSDEFMNFGLNKNVNCVGVKKEQPKKVHQEETPIHNLETLDNKTQQVKIKTPGKISTKKETDNINTELMAVLSITGITAFLITKYII